ncbi:hypothetical protein VFPPC_15703 [Pochonia chlamydosporia 170]|uniref:Uncharacterized protein n=1 Tax=Pochonia chlamydosporia 170 TaxID=1380566 RepID=A0A179FPS0_METCM|nr:hypothetical protein VFPPC_15703 [Pochonia chlamydosporia 170]OAQ67592.1 hypothetical protein VFPPC_15703 [Pochonia chlamydosporia 170]
MSSTTNPHQINLESSLKPNSLLNTTQSTNFIHNPYSHASPRILPHRHEATCISPHHDFLPNNGNPPDRQHKLPYLGI